MRQSPTPGAAPFHLFQDNSCVSLAVFSIFPVHFPFLPLLISPIIKRDLQSPGAFFTYNCSNIRSHCRFNRSNLRLQVHSHGLQSCPTSYCNFPSLFASPFPRLSTFLMVTPAEPILTLFLASFSIFPPTFRIWMGYK